MGQIKNIKLHIVTDIKYQKLTNKQTNKQTIKQTNTKMKGTMLFMFATVLVLVASSLADDTKATTTKTTTTKPAPPKPTTAPKPVTTKKPTTKPAPPKPTTKPTPAPKPTPAQCLKAFGSCMKAAFPNPRKMFACATALKKCLTG